MKGNINTILFLAILSLNSINAQVESCECDIKLNAKIKDDSICVFVNEMPTFSKQENKNLLTYFYLKMRLENIETDLFYRKYIISFVINRNGKLVRAKVNSKSRKDDTTKMEKEILRVLKKSPKWNPGVCNGIKVPIYMKMPLRINLKQ